MKVQVTVFKGALPLLVAEVDTATRTITELSVSDVPAEAKAAFVALPVLEGALEGLAERGTIQLVSDGEEVAS